MRKFKINVLESEALKEQEMLAIRGGRKVRGVSNEGKCACACGGNQRDADTLRDTDYYRNS